MLTIITLIIIIGALAFLIKRKTEKQADVEVAADLAVTKDPVGVITPEQSVKPVQKIKAEPVVEPVVEVTPEPVAEAKAAPAKPKAKTSGRPKKKK